MEVTFGPARGKGWFFIFSLSFRISLATDFCEFVDPKDSQGQHNGQQGIEPEGLVKFGTLAKWEMGPPVIPNMIVVAGNDFKAVFSGW